MVGTVQLTPSYTHLARLRKVVYICSLERTKTTWLKLENNHTHFMAGLGRTCLQLHWVSPDSVCLVGPFLLVSGTSFTAEGSGVSEDNFDPSAEVEASVAFSVPGIHCCSSIIWRHFPCSSILSCKLLWISSCSWSRFWSSNWRRSASVRSKLLQHNKRTNSQEPLIRTM